MRNWVDAIVSMSGFPVPAMQHAADASLRLLEWQYQGNGQPLTERLAVDETHLYQGLAMLAAKPPETGPHLYLARSAWHVGLERQSLFAFRLPARYTRGDDCSKRSRARAGYFRRFAIPLISTLAHWVSVDFERFRERVADCYSGEDGDAARKTFLTAH